MSNPGEFEMSAAASFSSISSILTAHTSVPVCLFSFSNLFELSRLMRQGISSNNQLLHDTLALWRLQITPLNSIRAGNDVLTALHPLIVAIAHVAVKRQDLLQELPSPSADDESSSEGGVEEEEDSGKGMQATAITLSDLVDQHFGGPDVLRVIHEDVWRLQALANIFHTSIVVFVPMLLNSTPFFVISPFSPNHHQAIVRDSIDGIERNAVSFVPEVPSLEEPAEGDQEEAKLINSPNGSHYSNSFTSHTPEPIMLFACTSTDFCPAEWA